MFSPKTEKIKELSEIYDSRIEEVNNLFDKPTNIYIDFANVIQWQGKLGWHIDIKRLKQFLDSFNTIKDVKFYNGTLQNDFNSEQIIKIAKANNYNVITKLVKIMKLSIDASSISKSSPEILQSFIRSPLLKKLDINAIEYLNERLKDLNKQGIMYLEDRKCNFDVEIGRDMLRDYDNDSINNFILWSGDSDFADPVKHLLDDKRKVILFATARKVSRELNELRDSGLLIFDIQKIRNFICYSKEIQQEGAYKSKKDSIS